MLNTEQYGTIADTIDIIKTEKKGTHLNTLEKYHMYKISKNKQHMNETYIDIYNLIFETLYELNTSSSTQTPSTIRKQHQPNRTS
jgi:hypothetical protein